MINSSITQSLRACITSVFRRSVQEKKKRKTFSEYWGATFNCLTTHVAKLSQLHQKHSAQTLAATGKLLGSSPNREPLCHCKPLKNMNPDFSKCLVETKRWNKEERRGGGELLRPRVSPPCSWNRFPSHPLPEPATTWKAYWAGFPSGEETGVCVFRRFSQLRGLRPT